MVCTAFTSLIIRGIILACDPFNNGNSTVLAIEDLNASSDTDAAVTLGMSLAHYPFANSCMEGNILYHVKVFGIIDSFIHLLTGQCLHIHIIYSTTGQCIQGRRQQEGKVVNTYIRENTRCPEVTLQRTLFTQSRVRGRPSGGCEVETETKDERGG